MSNRKENKSFYDIHESFIQVGDLIKCSGNINVVDGGVHFDEYGLVIARKKSWVRPYGCLFVVQWLKSGKITNRYENSLEVVQ